MVVEVSKTVLESAYQWLLYGRIIPGVYNSVTIGGLIADYSCRLLARVLLGWATDAGRSCHASGLLVGLEGLHCPTHPVPVRASLSIPILRRVDTTNTETH